MVSRLLFILTALIVFISCRSEKTRSIHFPQFGWTLPLPHDMKFEDSAFDRNGIIRDSMWEREIVRKQPRAELFQIRADRDNYCAIVVYEDSSDLTTWKKGIISDSREFYFDLIAGMPDTRIIDSSLSDVKLDNAEFLQEYINYKKKRNDMIFSYQFSRRYKKYAMYINIRYTDKKIGKRYLKMIKNSEFES